MEGEDCGENKILARSYSGFDNRFGDPHHCDYCILPSGGPAGVASPGCDLSSPVRPTPQVYLPLLSSHLERHIWQAPSKAQLVQGLIIL